MVIEGVTVTGGANPFNGWFIVAGSTDNTHFTYNTMSDSRNGAATTGSAGQRALVELQSHQLDGGDWSVPVLHLWTHGRQHGTYRSQLAAE